MKEYKYRINGHEYNIQIQSVEGAKAHVTVNGVAYEVETDQPLVAMAASSSPVAPAPQASVAAPTVAASIAAVQAAPAAPAPTPAVGGTKVKSPLPGVINDVRVQVGSQVAVGDVLVVLEAMKMENEIAAECAGTVISLAVSKGNSVMEGDVLVTIG